MREFFQICIFLLTAMGSFAGDHSSYQKSYQQLLESSRRSYGVNESLDSHRWKKWDGLNQLEGISSVVDDLARAYYERTGQVDSARAGLGYWILDNTALEEQEVLGVIIASADRDSGKPAALPAYFRLIEKYLDEPGAIAYVAKYLSDIRISPLLRVKLNRRTFYTTMDNRVCDFAVASISAWLDKKGFWERDTSEEFYRLNDRERQNFLIAKVNKILLEKGFIDYAVSPSDPVPRDRHGRAKGEVEKRKTTRQPRAGDPDSKQEQSAGIAFPRWVLGVVIILILGALALGLKIRASTGGR